MKERTPTMAPGGSASAVGEMYTPPRQVLSLTFDNLQLLDCAQRLPVGALLEAP